MKKLLIITATVFFVQICNAQIGFDYLGQTPPGNIPVIFASGIISVGGSIEKSIAISPKGDEIFFIKGSGWPFSKIMYMVKSAGKWSMPDTAFFSKDCWATEPAFSPDGQNLFFSSSRGKSDIRSYNLWRIKKNKGGWSEPESIIDIAGENIMEFHPSITKNGSVYFCYWDYAKQIGDIYLSKNIGGKLAAPVKVGFPISTKYNDTDPFVDEAESYMIFKSNRPGGYGDNDVYISFKKNDGTWTDPKNLGSSFNTPNNENPIDVSPDGKYMFLYLNNDMYWIRIHNLIDSLKKESFLIDYFGQVPPGSTPVKFAPGVISKDGSYELMTAFSPDGKEFCFTVTNNQWSSFSIWYTKYDGANWSEPKILPFTTDGFSPVFSPSGNALLYSTGGNWSSQTASIWACKQTDTIWGTPEKLNAPVNLSSGNDNWGFSMASDSTLLFTSVRAGGQGNFDLYISKLAAGGYTDVVNLENLNSSAAEYSAFIAPDKSYIIFSSQRSGGYGWDDLYISFQKENGVWSNPVNLGPKINTVNAEYAPHVTPDGKYLIYSVWDVNSNWSDIYWFRIDHMIDNLKSHESELR